MHLCILILSINIYWLEREQGYDNKLCYSDESLALSELIDEREARQLIMVQDSQISASVCLCVTLRNARFTSFCMWA